MQNGDYRLSPKQTPYSISKINLSRLPSTTILQNLEIIDISIYQCPNPQKNPESAPKPYQANPINKILL